MPSPQWSICRDKVTVENFTLAWMSNNRVGGAVACWLTPRTPDPEVGGFEPHYVLEQDIFTPKSTGNTQEAVVPSQHDWKLFTGTLSIKPNSNRVAYFTSLVKAMDLWISHL